MSSAGGLRRSPSPTPPSGQSLSPCPSYQPGVFSSQQRQPCHTAGPGAGTTTRNGSISPSLPDSLLQIPPPAPPPAAQPRPSSASSQSLQQQEQQQRSNNSSRQSLNQSSVFIPHLPPPPRPLSTPSLSTLVQQSPASCSSPQLFSASCSASSSKFSPKRQQQEQQERQELLRKYSDHNSFASASAMIAPPLPPPYPPGASALRVDHLNYARKSSSGSGHVVTSVVDLDHHHFRSGSVGGGGGDLTSSTATDPSQQDAARVKFLKKDPSERVTRLTTREKQLACLACILFAACVAFVLVAFARDVQQKAQNPDYCLTSTCVSTAAHLLAAMDVTADPCDDFFQYACGQWNQRNEIPEDEHSYNTFQKLHDELQIILRQLLEQGQVAHDSNATLKAKTFYQSCINMTQIRLIGDGPLHGITEDLGGWPIIKDRWDNASFNLETVLAKIRHDYNAPILIGCWVAVDDKNSSVNIIRLDQPMLGMPDREYYLKAKSESEFVQAYLNFMRGVVKLMGAPMNHVEKQLLDLLEFETHLANVTRPRAERQDTGALYNKMTIATLQKLVPQLNWLQYLRQAVNPTLTSEEEVLVFALDYLYDMMNIVTRTDTRTVANYLIWRVVMMLAPELTENYQEVNNKYKMVLHGVKRGQVRWKKCVKDVNKQMGMAIGAMFVRDNFRRQSKDTALEMIQDIRNAFNELLEENDWMDEATKAVAREKANAIDARIGYPDFITDLRQLDAKYEGLTLQGDNYFNNILAIKRFEARSKMERLRKHVVQDDWEQAPADINAFYNPNFNDIVFPAGILQPAFYSEHFPKSLNYGGIGVVIGHEITHGFDDKGRQYDINGNLAQWWDNATIDAFRKRTQCMVDQYSSFKLEQTGHTINGKHTQGENIADNGGLKQAYRAYRKWVEEHGQEPPLPGIELTHDQLFFLNFAQIWCGKVRDEEALITIRTSAHSPGPIRVLGPLSNSKDFARAYSCPAGTRMNPHHKCSVW